MPADRIAEDDGGFGEVGGQDVGVAGEAGHRFAQLGRVGGVHLAVVGHDRVDHAQRVREALVERADDVDLLGRAEKARVHGVDVDADSLPCVQVVAQDVGGVVHVPAGKGGVAREQAGRHGAYIAACGGEHRDRHAEGAFSVSAQVVNSRDARDVVAFAMT